MRTIARRSAPPAVIREDAGFPNLDQFLDRRGCTEALRLFREEKLDTVEIAWRLECTQAAAASGLARAREEERRAAA